ncbi:F-box protein CPR1-like [Rutidosis leptorrhynchoides]|uniref:F-box protein CPR1-like n=1 Tax=Rutidosis leptorrhynchoides TaxID=125765 RepID=UPI003A9925B4
MGIYNSPCLAVEVFSLGSNSWRSLSSIPPFQINNPLMVSARAEGHWIVYHRRLYKEEHDGFIVENTMISFDFMKEEFTISPLPDFGHGGARCELLQWGESLAIGYIYSDNTGFDTWVMKDYTKKQWEKIFSTDLKYFMDETNRIHILMNLKDDEFLLQIGNNDLILYNPTTGAIKSVEYDRAQGNLEGGNCPQGQAHVLNP